MKSLFTHSERILIIKQARGIRNTFLDRSMFKSIRYVLKFGVGSEILLKKVW